MPLDNQLEQIRRRSLDLWIQKLPFQIIFAGLGAIIFLRGFQSKQITLGIVTAAVAIIAMYGRHIWAAHSNKSKSFWCFGINLVFWVPAFLVAPHLGKFVLVFTALAVVLLPLTFVLEWIYQRLLARRG